MTGQRGGLAGDTLLEASVTAENDDMVVQDGVLRGVEAGCSHLLGHGEADAVGNALSKGSGCRLDTRGLVELGMSRRDAVELAELLHLIERNVESGEMEPRVEEHAAVTSGEDESVAVKPAGIYWIELKRLTKKNGSDIGRSKRQAEMTRLAGGDGVDGNTAGIAGGKLEDFVIHKNSVIEQTSDLLFASLLPSQFRNEIKKSGD